MPYPINRTDGSLLTTIQDYTRDTESTSLTLLGRGSVDYGEAVAENFVHMLESFAAPIPPANPLQGQVWFHTFDPGPPITTVNKLKLFDGTNWVNVGGATSSVNPPDTPEPGDLWYNMETNAIYYWDGYRWKKVGGPSTGLDPDKDPSTIDPTIPVPGPDDPDEGELWWMLPERKLFAYDSSLASKGTFPPNQKRVDGSAVPNGWVLIGPDGARDPNDPDGGSYTEVTIIKVIDPVTGEEKEVPMFKIIVNGVLVAVYTNEVVRLIENEIDGLPFGAWFDYTNPGESDKTLNSGLNMNHAANQLVNGQAADAERLNGLNASQFLRSDETTYPITTDIVYDLGKPDQHWRRIYGKEIYAGTSNGDTEEYDTEEVNIFGKALYAEKTDYAEKSEMFVEAKSLKTETADSDVEIVFENLFATADNDFIGTAMLTQKGKDSVKEVAQEVVDDAISTMPSGSFVPLDKSSVPTGQHDLGSPGAKWGTIYANLFDGMSTSTKYADLAERYAADAVYAPGTLVSIGGTHEITKTSGLWDYNFFGVISTNPGHLMNADAGENETHPPVALTGRVPVRVIGEVRKGQRLILSETPGVAQAYGGDLLSINEFHVVGRALEDKTDDAEGLVLAVVQTK